MQQKRVVKNNLQYATAMSFDFKALKGFVRFVEMCYVRFTKEEELIIIDNMVIWALKRLFLP